jgi:hypothetical protein
MVRLCDIHHLSQLSPKVVQVIEDAPERYEHDETWKYLSEPDKHFGIRCLEASKGQKCIVLTAQRRGNVIWYELFFDPPLEVENVLGTKEVFHYLHISADYVRILDSGFLEAR